MTDPCHRTTDQHQQLSKKLERKDTPMSVSIQTLQDALVAIGITVGIALALTIALVAVGALFERGRADRADVRRSGPVLAPHPTPTDDARELVLR
jgi:hypothetical protein